MNRKDAASFSELYSAYAAGTLDPAFALMLDAQSMLSPEVRRAIAAAEAVSGRLLEGEAVAPMSDGALHRVFAALDMPFDAPPPPVKTEDPELNALPDPLRRRVVNEMARSDWKPLTPGIRRLKLDVGSPLEVELYRIEPGARVPRHSHAGTEYTLVVSGGFTDETGSHGPGHLVVNGPEDTHRPVGDSDGVCYAFAIRDGGLRFTGVMGVIQRLFGG